MVLVAITGTMFYADASKHTAAPNLWTAEFLVSGGPGPGGGGTAQDGQNSSANINFAQVNITTVTFQFQFTDNYRFSAVSPAGARFRVVSPTGLSGESTLNPGQDTATTITIRDVAGVPDASVFPASDRTEAARLALKKYPANENGTGDWTVEVTVTRDYLTPVHPTGSIAWTATTRVEAYALEISERLPE